MKLIRALAGVGRMEIIRTLRAYPGRDFTINELGRTSRVPIMTTWRAVKDLKAVGLVKARKVGNATIVSITEDREALRALRLIPETDPQRMAALSFAQMVGQNEWLEECRLFGSIGRGEHSPGEEVDVAVVYDDGMVSEESAKSISQQAAHRLKEETNVTVVPLCVSAAEIRRKGGLGAELRDKESIWVRADRSAKARERR
jgi:predicted nucleotidyltransferase